MIIMCRECYGSGQVRMEIISVGYGASTFEWERCPTCGGRGYGGNAGDGTEVLASNRRMRYVLNTIADDARMSLEQVRELARKAAR